VADDDEKKIGAALFNGAWDLIEKTDRTADEDLEMLTMAMASRWHWGQVGGPSQLATGDWQVARTASLIGLGDLALRFASRNMATTEAEGWDGWRLASAHEGLARAYATLGDAEGRARHLAAAGAALEREPDAEERRIIEGQLATVPEV
jgi:hypothetical protein